MRRYLQLCFSLEKCVDNYCINFSIYVTVDSLNNSTGGVCAVGRTRRKQHTMKLLTESIRKELPPLHATENDPEPVARVKFFTPWTIWTWYVLEFDGKDVFFGLVEGIDTEWGYFSLAELESVRGPGGLTIERDLYWEPRRIPKGL